MEPKLEGSGMEDQQKEPERPPRRGGDRMNEAEMRRDVEKKMEIFESHRDRLFALAYRMLGLRADAEDILQEGLVAWLGTDLKEVRTPGPFLTRVITNLCLDELRSARRRREEYVGPWLPEPVETDRRGDPSYQAELADSLSIAFLRLLEQLSPPERAVFLLREVFHLDYEEIAETIDVTETNCRQIAHRARRRLQDEGEPRFDTSISDRDRLMQTFEEALNAGNLELLKETLAEDITLVADGGGKALVAGRPLTGLEEVAKFLYKGVTKFPHFFLHYRRTFVNGEPAFVFPAVDPPYYVWSLHIEGGKIQNIFVIANPDKLGKIRRGEEGDQEGRE